MQNPVIITSDSTCDLSSELIERYNIKLIPLTITMGNDSYLDGIDFHTPDIYSRYRKDGSLPKTAAPSLNSFSEFFKSLKAEGFDIVHLDISSELSSTYSNASIAATDFEGVHVVDSRMLSTGVGLLAIEGVECAASGMSAYEIAEHLRSLTSKIDTSFVLDTLEFMWKGGRCSGIAALGANILKLKPALEMSDGKLGIYKKYRGNMTKVYEQYITERLSGKNIRPGHVFITESGEVGDDIIEHLKEIIYSCTQVKEIHHTVAGCTVASHCGPGTLGVLFINE